MGDDSFFKTMDSSTLHWKSRNKGLRLAGALVFDMRFIIRDPHLPETRARAARALDQLRAFVPDSRYAWWWTREGTKPRPVSPNLPAAAALVAGADAAGDAFNFLIFDAEDPALDASRHSLAVRYPASFADGAQPVGSFQFSAPLTWIETREPGFIRDLFVHLTVLLAPRFGWGGFALTAPLAMAGSAVEFARAEAHPFLKRFPGVDSGEAMHLAEFLSAEFGEPEGGLPTVNWLTYADDATLTLCGGRGKVISQLGQPRFPIFAYGAGVTIQAGPNPEIGDLDAGLSTPHYAHVAQVLKPARLVTTDYPINLSFGGPGTNLDYDRFLKDQNEYLTKFDRMAE